MEGLRSRNTLILPMEIKPHSGLMTGLLILALVSLVAGAYRSTDGWTRSFEMGLIYWPTKGPSTPQTVVSREIDYVTENSEIIVCQAQWSPYRLDNLNRCFEIADKAKESNDKFVVALEWLDYGRGQLLDADQHSWSFSDPEVQRKFLSSVDRIVVRTEPQYFLVGVEVNYLKHLSPEEYEHFVHLYEKARNRIRRERPNCEVTVSFQYELLQGLGPFEDGTKDAVMAFDSGLDVLGISTYPLLVTEPPETIPRDYYKPLSEIDMEIVIFETAWPTRPWIDTGLAELRQQVYVDRMFNAFNEINAEAVVWTTGLDTPAPSAIDSDIGTGGDARWPSYLGLWRTVGDPKRAAQRWHRWLDRPISRGVAGAR